MAKQSVPVPFSSIRSKYSTINVHPLNETSSRFLKETGHPPSPVPGRYAHHRIDPTGDPSIHSDGHESPGISGFYNKHREVGTNPNLDNHISWLYDQFDNNALHSALRKKEKKKGPVHNSIPCSGENQCGCRSRVERILGQQRLDVRPVIIRPFLKGCMLHGPVRLATYPSTDDLHQHSA